jgi:hypothetical protein
MTKYYCALEIEMVRNFSRFALIKVANILFAKDLLAFQTVIMGYKPLHGLRLAFFVLRIKNQSDAVQKNN